MNDPVTTNGRISNINYLEQTMLLIINGVFVYEVHVRTD